MREEEVTPASARLCFESVREALVMVLQDCETLVTIVPGVHVENDETTLLSRSDRHVGVRPATPPFANAFGIGGRVAEAVLYTRVLSG
jgi:hypothetical protein